jgi:hypothetical protein
VRVVAFLVVSARSSALGSAEVFGYVGPEHRPEDLWIEIAKKVHEYAKEETDKNIFGR